MFVWFRCETHVAQCDIVNVHIASTLAIWDIPEPKVLPTLASQRLKKHAALEW
jgi:hypothetical protein